jgi:hypothetical protein
VEHDPAIYKTQNPRCEKSQISKDGNLKLSNLLSLEKSFYHFDLSFLLRAPLDSTGAGGITTRIHMTSTGAIVIGLVPENSVKRAG